MKNLVKNTFSVLLLEKNILVFLGALLAFGLLYSFFYGVFLIPFANIGFYREMSPLIGFDYFYIAAASVLSAIILTLTFYISAGKGGAGKTVSGGGVFAGIFGAVCPACLGVNFLAFGNVLSAPLAFLVPYLRAIQVTALSLLALGAWLTMRSAYDKVCIACQSSGKTGAGTLSTAGELRGINSKLVASLLIIAVIALVYQASSLTGAFSSASPAGADGAGSSSKVDLNKVTLQVLPEQGFTIDAVWGDSVSKMVKSGALDIDKLDSLLANRYSQPLTQAQRSLLTADYSNEKLGINNQNAVFMMYVLWVLGKQNDNPILHDSPFAKYFDDYDIGVGKPGYGDTALIALTPEQQETAKYVAMNSYRPCCGNPTGNPDCSHGFSALGLIQLMAAQGYGKEAMFDAFVKFNSFWFPSTYIQDALYFQLAEGKSWEEVDKALVAGKDHSSLSGSYAVKNYLEGLGI